MSEAVELIRYSILSMRQLRVDGPPPRRSTLAWRSTQFDLVMEDNRIKVFGASLISSRAVIVE
jgi:phenylalanine-4-hydroxylase